MADKEEMLAFIENLADSQGYSESQKMTVFAELQKVLNQVSPLTVASLEEELIKLHRNLNLELLAQILTDIKGFGTKITNATHTLEQAIDDLNDLNQIFGVITLGFSIFAALPSAARGNFSLLTGLLL